MRACGTARRDAQAPGHDVPDDGAHQRPEDDRVGDDIGADDARADGFGDVQAEDEERDEVEERSPGHRVTRRQNARRHDGGDRIGSVVQAVQEIEQQSRSD